MGINEMKHKKRILDYLGIGHTCNCPFSPDWEKDDFARGCDQRDFYNGKHSVAGTYGHPIFLCNWCYEDHGLEVDKWSQGRRDFVNKVQTEDPKFWEASTRHAQEIMKSEGSL